MDGYGAPTLPLPQDTWQDEGGHPVPTAAFLWQSGVYSVFLSTLFINFFAFFFPPKRVSAKMWNHVLSSFLEFCGISPMAGMRET